MHHIVARTQHRRAAFSTWEEGLRLWRTVLGVVPGVIAVCVMPDHVHILCPHDHRARVGHALGGYARWRNRQRGHSGALWQPLPEPSRVEGRLKIRRNIRYIHLNPCRGRLVDDPLAWPLSTHLDMLGLVDRPVRPRVPDAESFHRYVSSDPAVGVSGSHLPSPSHREPDPAGVLDATSLVLRLPSTTLRRRGPGRVTSIRALRTLTPIHRAEVAELVQTSPDAITRVPPRRDPTTALIERWAGDPRCTPMDDAALFTLLRRSRYHDLRP